MSVSIVVNGRLWGLLACHHMAPKRVPYSIRMAADVLAQVMASTVQTIEMREDADLVERAAKVRTSLVESLLLEEDPLEALLKHADAMLESADAQAMVATQFGRVVCRGIDQACAETIVAALPEQAHDPAGARMLEDWPRPCSRCLGKWAGMLACPSIRPAAAGASCCAPSRSNRWPGPASPIKASSARWANA
jgi:chemotaxis family two-component system sensor kinase Cph1